MPDRKYIVSWSFPNDHPLPALRTKGLDNVRALKLGYTTINMDVSEEYLDIFLSILKKNGAYENGPVQFCTIEPPPTSGRYYRVD